MWVLWCWRWSVQGQRGGAKKRHSTLSLGEQAQARLEGGGGAGGAPEQRAVELRGTLLSHLLLDGRPHALRSQGGGQSVQSGA